MTFKTHLFNLTIKELDGSRTYRYSPITESKSTYRFEIDKKGNMNVHFLEHKQRKIGFNLKKYFRYELHNIDQFRYDDADLSIKYVYDVDKDFPVAVKVVFLKDNDYREAVRLIRSFKVYD